MIKLFFLIATFFLTALPVWGQDSLKGTVTYRQRSALPPKAVVEVELQDVSKADAPAQVIARQKIKKPGQVPIPFVIQYSPKIIIPNHIYAVRATIKVEDELFFVTDTHYPVLTGGVSGPVEIVVVPVASKGEVSLENTYWELIQVKGEEAVKSSGPGGAHLKLIAEGHRLTGSGGCNRIIGGYELDGERLSFTGTAGTKMFCADRMEAETSFLKILENVRSFKIEGKTLLLLDESGAALAKFMAGTEM